MSISVKFNGSELNNYIDVLQGFTPHIGVDWQPSIDSFDGGKSGDSFKYQRYGAKEIPMPFRIRKNLKSKYDELEKILSVTEPKRLIFGDQPERYFLAVPSGNLNLEQVWQSGTGEITWIVPDGLAHSTTLKEFTAAAGDDGVLKATIVNNSTVDVPISYEISHESDNGYIGIVSDKGAMQYGFIEEADGHTYQHSERLLTLSDVLSASDDAAGSWCYLQPDLAVNGSLGQITTDGRTWLNLAKTGSGSVWHGGQRTITLPADSNGERGATNFYLYMRHWFENWRLSELGWQGVCILDDDNHMIAGWRINKSAQGASKSYCDFFSNNKSYLTTSFEAINSSANLCSVSNGNNCIYKEGDILTFFLNGKGYKSFTVPEIATWKATKVQITIGGRGTANAMTRNYLGAFDFDKLYVEKWADDPNRYGAGDVVTIDGEANKIYVNGLIRMSDEVRGTTYFKASPGTTSVEFCKSDWANDITAKAYIREAWL